MEAKTVPQAQQKNGKRTEPEHKEIAPRGEFTPLFDTFRPFPFMRRFAEDMDRLFEDWGLGRFGMTTSFKFRPFLREFEDFENVNFVPQIERFVKDGNFIVRADLPGVKKEDLKIEIDENNLLITGERKQEKEEKGEGYFHSERNYGSFYRSIPLPEGAETEKVKATFNDGVLEVTLKAPETKENRKKITIE
jgi:HSP20 family protein